MWGIYAPLGYDIVDRKLIINTREAESIRHIYPRYLEVGGVRQLCDYLVNQGIRSKLRNSDERPGGSFFSRGALYHLLSNTIYIGQIRHKGICHPGQHEGIIDQELWDRVQQQLISNRAGTVEQSRKTEPGSLSGKIFDAITGEALVIVHANKKGRRYRYYISQSLKNGIKDDSPNGWRLPGAAIESTIFGIAQSMLNDRDAMVDALQAAKIPSPHIPALLSKAHEAGQHPQNVFNSFMQRVELRHDGIRVRLSLVSLVPEKTDGEDISITRDTPMQIKRRGHEMRLVIEGDGVFHSNADPILVKTIARALTWSEELISGRAKSMAEIASRSGVSDSYVRKLLPLAYLAPDIVEAIMAGKQPAHLTSQMLIRQIDIPLDWQQQKQVLGFVD